MVSLVAEREAHVLDASRSRQPTSSRFPTHIHNGLLLAAHAFLVIPNASMAAPPTIAILVATVQNGCCAVTGTLQRSGSQHRVASQIEY